MNKGRSEEVFTNLVNNRRLNNDKNCDHQPHKPPSSQPGKTVSTLRYGGKVNYIMNCSLKFIDRVPAYIVKVNVRSCNISGVFCIFVSVKIKSLDNGRIL